MPAPQWQSVNKRVRFGEAGLKGRISHKKGRNDMSILKEILRARSAFLLAGAAAMLIPGSSSAQLKQPLLSEDNLKRVSDHVSVIEGFPNVVIVVGSRATLVVDTGLGEKNGATVMRVEQKLAKGPILYLTTTHYHSEHTTGESAFPPSTIIIRNIAQQDEMNKGVGAHIEAFKKMSAQNMDLLQTVKFRPPDVLFDREAKIDLGGVTARLFWLGPAHTKGDMLTYIEEDSVLIPGDIVQKDIFPIMPNADASVKGWLSILDNIESLHPKFIVPDHGAAIVDASQIGTERAYLLALQARALELKKQGASADDAGKTITAELKAKYPDWPNPNNVAGEVQRVYEQSQ
jgi:glyoxylase-like metal-dependent hydrolase (beta-lactamase superfamily II)